jgi:hypothetical protein
MTIEGAVMMDLIRVGLAAAERPLRQIIAFQREGIERGQI